MSSMLDSLHLADVPATSMAAGKEMDDAIPMTGHFDIKCLDNAGNVLWEEGIDNLVVTVGINQILLAGVSGSTPAYMGLISSVGYSTLVATDTMSSHPGWNEAQNTGTNTPSYGTTRPSVTYNAPANGTITTAGTIQFVATGTGTVEGAFIVCGSGASATVGNTGGVLMSEGLFMNGGTPQPQPVVPTNTIVSTYTLVA